MKIYALNSISQNNYKKQKVQNINKSQNTLSSNNYNSHPNFRSDRGALIGMAAGAVIGAGAIAITIATGGLAAVVAAAGGATGVIAGGAGAGAQIGGIIGGLTSEKENGNNTK